MVRTCLRLGRTEGSAGAIAMAVSRRPRHGSRRTIWLFNCFRSLYSIIRQSRHTAWVMCWGGLRYKQPTQYGIMSLRIERVTAPTAAARMLITELEAELSTTYSTEQRHGLNLDRIFRPDVSFFIARLAGEAVGCGGIAFIDGAAELKRIYVRPEARGQGIAQAILARLQEEAHARGVNLLMLETGDAQHAAIRLYQRAGFRRCAPFGEYAKMPPLAIVRSVFFEKPLT